MQNAPPSANSRNRLIRLIAKLRDISYRNSYVESHTKLFLARQMRAFRGDKTQKQFADALGVSQSVVSERLENPNYGKSSLQTLFDTAAKLNVAVFVRFVDFETFLKLSEDMSDNAVRPAEYDQKTLDELSRRQELKIIFGVDKTTTTIEPHVQDRGSLSPKKSQVMSIDAA